MKVLKFVFPLTVVLVVFAFGWNHVSLGLWYDEVLSIKEFVLHDFIHTATYYPEPNNHIFFNLFNNVMTRLIGVRDFHELLDYVVVLRGIQWMVGLITLGYIFRFASKFFNLETAWIATIVFATTLPFLNYMVQLRGYNFSMLFVIMALYYVHSYLVEQKRTYLFLMAGSLFLLVYTMPSNVYFFTALMLVLGANWLYNFVKNNKAAFTERIYGSENNKYWNLLWGGAVSSFFIMLAYAPVISNMLNDKYLNRVPDDRFFALTVRLPKYLGSAVSGRQLLILLAICTMLYGWRFGTFKIHARKCLGLFFLLLMPFVFSFLQNNYPLARTFVHLTPIFALLVAIPLGLVIQSLDMKKSLKTIVISCIYAYCIFSLSVDYKIIQNQLSWNLKKGKRAQNNYFAYYQAHSYRPDLAAKQILAHYKENPYPVVLAPKELDAITLMDYLNKYEVKNYFLKRISPINHTADKRYLEVWISNSGLSEEPTVLQKETIKVSKKMKKSAFRAGRFAALIDYMNSKEQTDKFYVTASYDKVFWKQYANYYKEEYDVQQLNKEENSFNIYLFEKKQHIGYDL